MVAAANPASVAASTTDLRVQRGREESQVGSAIRSPRVRLAMMRASVSSDSAGGSSATIMSSGARVPVASRGEGVTHPPAVRAAFAALGEVEPAMCRKNSGRRPDLGV